MPQFQWLDDEQLVQDLMLRDLGQQVRDLFDQVRALDGGFPLLRFLAANANTLMTIEDIAYFLKKQIAEVEPSLFAMVDIGLARYADVVGLAFFGLTSDPARRQRVRELCDWQDRWNTCLARIGDRFNGKARPLPAPKSV